MGYMRLRRQPPYFADKVRGQLRGELLIHLSAWPQRLSCTVSHWSRP